MKKQNSFLFSSLIVAALSLTIFACSKTDSGTNAVVSEPLFTLGQNVSTAKPLTGSIKGTMLADSVYYIGSDVTINAGDTLLIQRGVKVYFQGNFNFIVKGSLIAFGTKDKQIYFGVSYLTRTDNPGYDETKDSAYVGKWGGLLGDISCPLMVIKWAHIEFGCGKVTIPPTKGLTKNSYMISFVNPNGTLVLEDSWIYGGVDDPIRLQGGNVHIMRNTFEKGGYTGGEGLNIKSGTIGNIAYNLFIGCATNGIKPSNAGTDSTKSQTDIVAYNNTMVNCGYRRNSEGRGGSINYEELAKGSFYNNLMVNCKYGPRIVPSDISYYGNALKAADTARIFYSNNFQYGDSLSIVNQFFPVLFSTKPQSSDIPLPSNYLPVNYKLGDAYNAQNLVSKNNPQFVNYPLPAANSPRDISVATGFDFHLKSTSPCIGAGTTSFAIKSNVKVDANFGATLISQPSKDIGAYPTDGTGNLH